ncbi:MAG TPA: VWA domain-containing protein, partial [Planctomycetaceae bacterium]|nr:VWA domain-containing protein [Planctomycetaceae bacterium]
MFVKKFTALLLVLFAIQTSVVFADVAQPNREVLLIVDSSGSMKENTTDGVEKMIAAKQALLQVLPELNGDHVGLLLFGHRVAGNRAGCCEDIELAIPISPLSSSKFISIVNQIQPLGNTPLAQSLWVAKDVLTQRQKDVQKTIIVLTDGNETCNGDPQAAAAALARLGINVKVHVVGFAVNAQQERQLKSIAASGNGTYTSAKDAATLVKVLPKFVMEKPAAPPKQINELSRIEAALVARLQDKEYTVRISSLDSLRTRKAYAAVPAILQSLADDGHYVGKYKSAALKALRVLAPNQVEGALIKALTSNNYYVRRWAADNLVRVNDKSTQTKLSRVDEALVKRLLQDKEYTVRISSLDALRNRKVHAALPAILQSLADDGHYVGKYKS